MTRREMRTALFDWVTPFLSRGRTERRLVYKTTLACVQQYLRFGLMKLIIRDGLHIDKEKLKLYDVSNPDVGVSGVARTKNYHSLRSVARRGWWRVNQMIRLRAIVRVDFKQFGAALRSAVLRMYEIKSKGGEQITAPALHHASIFH